MTDFLDLADLHRLSAFLDDATATGVVTRHRPRLTARWHLGAGGRPVCVWTDTDDPQSQRC